MERGARVLGVIMARGGSKGLPGKNILPLAGKPVIAYTIDAAQKARQLDRLVVSTDDREIAQTSADFGADVPFMRPPELAQDDTLAFPVLKHATLWLEEHGGYVPDYVLCLQPTTPLRTAEDIDNSIELALAKDADAVVAYAPAQQHPYWMKIITEDGRLCELFPPDPALFRRQNLPLVYHPSGSIYLAKRDLILKGNTFYTDKTFAYLVPRERAIDIDTLLDLRLAELLLQERASPSPGLGMGAQ